VINEMAKILEGSGHSEIAVLSPHLSGMAEEDHENI
jgi:hypothetical protein